MPFMGPLGNFEPDPLGFDPFPVGFPTRKEVSSSPAEVRAAAARAEGQEVHFGMDENR